MIYLCLCIGFLTKIAHRRSDHEHITPHVIETKGITGHQAQIFDFLDKDIEAQINKVIQQNTQLGTG